MGRQVDLGKPFRREGLMRGPGVGVVGERRKHLRSSGSRTSGN